jgi:hypothetical protein
MYICMARLYKRAAEPVFGIALYNIVLLTEISGRIQPDPVLQVEIARALSCNATVVTTLTAASAPNFTSAKPVTATFASILNTRAATAIATAIATNATNGTK